MYSSHKLILGTVQLGIDYGINNLIGKQSYRENLEILNYAYENGILYLDTAAAYGDAETLIGNFHKQYPSKIFKVITKFHDEDIIDNFGNTLEKISVSRLFSYMFHQFLDTKNNAIVNYLISLKKIDKIENIGVSIYTNEEFEEAIELEYVDIIQIPYNLLDNSNKRLSLIKKAKDKNKKIHVRSVFLQGLFFTQTDSLPIKLRPLEKYIKQINAIAENYNIDKHELALQYVIFNKYIDGVIIGVDNLNQLKDNIKLGNQNLPIIYKEIFKKIDNINVEEEELLNPTNWK